MPIRLVLINIFDPDEILEDAFLIRNATNVLDTRSDRINPWDFVGADSDASDRNLRERSSFNYFRLGDATSSEQPDSSVQRRIVIANGNTSELLFTLTPVGTGSEVNLDILPLEQNIIDSVDSVQLLPAIPDNLEIVPTGVQVDGNNVMIQFESAPGLTGFSILGSEDLSAGFAGASEVAAQIVETGPGLYQATVNRVTANLPDRFFMQVTLQP